MSDPVQSIAAPPASRMTADEYNALPEKARRYIMWLETEADPAGTIRENLLVKDENAMLRAKLAELIPDELRKIGELIRTQDNRITDAPMFVVQRKEEFVGDEDYGNGRTVWIDDNRSGDGLEVEPELAEELEQKWLDDYEVPEGYRRIHMGYHWRFVTGCFTEQGCKDFLKIDGHNHGETRIFAEGTYRNYEYRVVRDFLKGLDSLEVAGSTPQAEDAARWRWFVKNCVRTSSLDMGGKHGYQVTGAFGRLQGPTLNAAVDAARKLSGEAHDPKNLASYR